MKVNVAETSPVERKVDVELPAETVNERFTRAYQDLGRRVRIKGFRAGKAPRSVLQGIYGNDIKGQVRSELVEDSLGQIIKERGLQIVSRPAIEANDLQDGQVFSFSAVFEVKPEIDLHDYTGIPLLRLKLSPTEAQVEAALKQLQESQARLEPVEDREFVQNGDFVTLDFSGSIGGKSFTGGRAENYVLEVGGGRALREFEERLAGLRVDEPKTIQVTYPRDYPNREIAGKTVDFSVVVHNIKQKVLPAIDDEFAKDQGEYGSLEELKVAVRSRLSAELKRLQDEELKEQILTRLIEAHPFTAPPAMVERQTRYLAEQQSRTDEGRASESNLPTREETHRNVEDRAVRQVKAILLLERIAGKEKIGVSDTELQERIESIARAAEDNGKTVRQFYSRAESRDELRSQMLFDRTLNFLLERAAVQELDSGETKVDDEPEKR